MKASSERAADQAYRMLRDDIVGGVLSGGSHLAETDLAEQYGFSRTPIRESLRRLQSEGLVEVIPHRGARVLDWRSFDIEGIYELRAVVEAFVARRAATRVNEKAIAELDFLCDRMEDSTNSSLQPKSRMIADFVDLNAKFHGMIAEAADANYVVPARNVLVVLPVILQALHNYAPTSYARSNRHHRELIDAFRQKDADWAESIMRAHVLSSKTNLITNLGANTMENLKED